jgi:hypothetical protein
MKRRDILTILIPSLIIVVLWVLFSIYDNFVSSTIPNTVSAQIQSITPNFDQQAIDSINKRNAISPIYSVSAKKEPGTGEEESPIYKQVLQVQIHRLWEANLANERSFLE